jgi:hypothetical protein
MIEVGMNERFCSPAREPLPVSWAAVGKTDRSNLITVGLQVDHQVLSGFLLRDTNTPRF